MTTIPLFTPPAQPEAPRLAKPLALPAGIRTSVTWGTNGNYRLALSWMPNGSQEKHLPVVIGLNPSAASDRVADRTLLRLIRDFCPRGFTMTNLFALRATDPEALLSSADPVGVGNYETLIELMQTRPMVIAAWGAPPSTAALHRLYMVRQHEVRIMLRKYAGMTVRAFGLTLGGYPRHPLYLRSGCEPQRWEP